MNTKEAEEKLENYLLNGLQAELHWAKEARALAIVIGNHSKRINSTRFAILFGRLQEVFSERETLAVAKIFDRPNKRNPVRSIPSTLSLIEENASLWSLKDRDYLEQFLHKNGYSAFTGKSNYQISIDIVKFYQINIPSIAKKDVCALSSSLEAVFQSRDKIHAHNEAILASDRTLPKWGDTKNLISYAEDFISTITRGFLGIHHIVSEPNRTAKQLEMLMSVSNLVNEEFKQDQKNVWVIERLRKELFEKD